MLASMLVGCFVVLDFGGFEPGLAGDGDAGLLEGGVIAPFALEVAPKELTLQLNEPQSVEVTIVRTAGFSGDVSVTPADVPPGIGVSPDPSSTSEKVRFVVVAKERKVSGGTVGVVGTAGSITLRAAVAFTVAARPGDLDVDFGDGGVGPLSSYAQYATTDSVGRIVTTAAYGQATPTSPQGGQVVEVRRSFIDGGADPTFGDGGVTKYETPGDGGPGFGLTEPAIDREGRIVVAPWKQKTSGTYTTNVVRLLPNGALDPSGTSVIAGDYYANIYAVASSDSKGNIVVARTEKPDQDYRVRVDRYQNGARDPSFGYVGPGVNYGVINGTRIDARRILDLPDGRILVAGEFGDNPSIGKLTLVWISPNGAATSTSVALPIPAGTNPTTGACHAGTTVVDGGVFLSGYTAGLPTGWCTPEDSVQDPHLVVAKVGDTGAVDTSFADGGILRIEKPNAIAIHVAEQPDGKILVAGGVLSEGRFGPMVLRFQKDGSPDPTFGNSFASLGTTLFGTVVPVENSYITHVAYINGRIVAVGARGGGVSFVALIHP